MKAVLTLVVCLLFWGQAAWGHAALVSADPAPGVVLSQPPAAVVLTFSEPVSVTALRLLGPRGPATALKPDEAGGERIRVPWPAQAGQGEYLLSWRVVSADGHPVGGALEYAVGAGAASAGQAPMAATSGVRPVAIWLGRWLGYLCLFAGVGAALFRARTPAVRYAWARPLIWAGLVLLPVNLGLQGLDLLDQPAAALLGRQAWAAALDSRYAWTLGLSALALLASWAAVQSRRAAVVRRCAGLGLVLAGVALAASGHAGTAPPQWLSRPLVVLHGMTAAAWLGALVPLFRLLGGKQAGDAGLAPLAWFARWITPAVAVLLLSGLGLVWLQLDHPADLWRTDYGRVLCAKLVLVAGLLAIAAFNRWRCTDAALAGESVARGRLRHSIGVETLVAVALLAVVSLWRFTPPPRALDAVAAPVEHAAVSLMLSNARVHAEVERSDGAWTIQLMAPTGQAFAAQGLTLAFSNPAAGIEPLRRQASRLADGRWRLEADGLPPTSAGRWHLDVEILVDDFDQMILSGDLPS